MGLSRIVAFAIALGAVVTACGARTGLVAPEANTRSNQFCVNASYDSGFTDLDLLFLLDRSGSMDDTGKWPAATAALTSFASDPTENGLGVSLAFFPPEWGDACNADNYAHPVVPMTLLPAGAGKISSALAGASPGFGSTPLAEALTGGVEYARGIRLADPTRQVAIAVITDGEPEGCSEITQGEAVHAVEGVAAEAFQGQPSIMTFIIGLAIGSIPPMNAMAAAGGTNQAILIDANPNTAQKIVDALANVRDGLAKCRFPIPSAGDAKVTPEDLAVSYAISPSDPSVQLTLYSSADACGAHDGFVVDDPSAPTKVQLCPQTCSTVHAHTTSKVSIVVGCGLGAPDGGVHGDAGACPNQSAVSCVASCTSQANVDPVCSFGEWTCPSGSVDSTKCKCPAVPHGCCIGDGTWQDASCVNAQWVCPAGATFFGTGTCAPPAACAPLLPCGTSTFCKSPDFTCGASNVLGSCALVSSACESTNAVCGCDGKVHGTECDATIQGIDLADSSSCTPPPATFGCGPYFCRTADQICKKTVDLTKSVAQNSYACISASGCPTGCKCNQCQPCPAGHSACNESCTTDGAGDRFLTCAELP